MSTSYPGEYYPPEFADMIPDEDNTPEDDDGEDSPDFTPDDGSIRPDLPDVDGDNAEEEHTEKVSEEDLEADSGEGVPSEEDEL